MYIDKLDDIADEYKNKSNRTNRMKSIDVQSSPSVDFVIENNDKDRKFKACDHLRTSKYKNIFAKSYTSNWPKDVLAFKRKLKTLYHGHI